MKIISINTISSSFLMKDYELDFIMNWSSKTSQSIKKYYPDIEIECWTPERRYKKEREFMHNGIKYRVFPSVGFAFGREISLPMLKAISNEIKKEKIILHLHGIHNWHTYLIAFLFGNQKIIVQHHGGMAPMKQIFRKSFYLLTLPILIPEQIIEFISLGRVSLFYTLSDAEERYIGRLFKNSRAKYQTMGVPDHYFKSMNKDLARKELNIPNNQTVLLYVGRLHGTKGLKYLFQALTQIKMNYVLFLLGEGSQRESLEQFAKENKLNAKFQGYVKEKEKLLFLSAADALILASLSEGAPVTLMEAIAMNVPVITTSVGGISKMVEDGRDGYIIKPRSVEDILNAIIKLYKFPLKNVRKYAEKYRWKSIINSTVKDYTLLFNK